MQCRKTYVNYRKCRVVQYKWFKRKNNPIPVVREKEKPVVLRYPLDYQDFTYIKFKNSIHLVLNRINSGKSFKLNYQKYLIYNMLKDPLILYHIV